MNALSTPEAVSELLANLPPLPAVVRYYDNFTDSYGEVANPSNSDQWNLDFDGEDRTLEFSVFDERVRRILKCWCAFVLGDLSPVTAYKYLSALKFVPIDKIMGLLACSPQNARKQWLQVHACKLHYGVFAPLGNLLCFCCRFSIGAWGPEWLDLVSQLPYPKVDKYASVRIGDVFLTVSEEVEIIRKIDEVSARIDAGPASVSYSFLVSIAMLACSYQFGLRAKQIAMLEMRNIRIWDDGLDHRPAVHLTFSMIKQRSPKRVFPMVCRAKREWSPLFIQLVKGARKRGLAGGDHVYQCSPRECGQVIADMTEFITRRRTAGELRHTAAQRLIDAGASEEELAAFMGHSDLNTGLPYFRSSASQGERVNQALGVSAVYQGVVKIARDRFISYKELAELKGDQQIAGVPHGIPIAGIGGCSQGQPSCPYNPITSCYGCPKFMPVVDAGVHKKVLEDLRGVMKLFYSSSKGERGSPAFQLAETISTIQAVLTELGEQSNELLP